MLRVKASHSLRRAKQNGLHGRIGSNLISRHRRTYELDLMHSSMSHLGYLLMPLDVFLTPRDAVRRRFRFILSRDHYLRSRV